MKERVTELTLDEILAIDPDDRGWFLVALRNYACPPRVMPGGQLSDMIHEVPPSVRMVLLLDAFAGSIFSGGFGQFVVEHGDLASEVREACLTIGASRAAEYIDRASACFPGGSIPADEKARNDLTMRDEIDRCLAEADDTYHDSYDEVVDNLRNYVSERKVEVASKRMPS